jgi:tetratricopeptide (TPR) repeat protein
MAEDVQRFLAGEPILAKPVSKISRLYRKARKYPWTSGVVLVGLTGLGLTLGTLWPKLRHQESQLKDKETALTEVQERLRRQMRATAEAYLEAALVHRRAGHLQEMRSYIPRVKEVCDEAIQAIPNLAEPHYHLGRMYRAILMFEEAIQQQEEALRKDPNHPDGLYEMMLLLLRKVHERLPGLQVKSGFDEELTSLKKRTFECIQRLQSLREIDGARSLCLRGLQLLHEGDLDQARPQFELAIQKDRFLDEAYQALSWAAYLKSQEASGANREEFLAESVEWLEKGLSVDKGYIPHEEMKRRRLLDLERCRSQRGQSVDF